MRRVFVGLPLLLCMALVVVEARQPAAGGNPKKAMADARIAADAGRLKDALALYEAVVASQAKDAPKLKADALYEVAMIRLAPDQTVADSAAARTALETLAKGDPKSAHRREAAAILALLDQVSETSRRLDEQLKAAATRAETAEADAARYKARVDELTAKLETTAAQGGSVKAETDKLRQEVTSLRAENRTMRDDLKSTKAELEKKDAALRKIAGSIVSKTPK